MALSPVFVELKASIGEFQAKMGEAKAEIGKLEKKGEGAGQKLGALGRGAALGFAGVAVAVGGFGLEMADQWEKAHSSLESAIKNAGGNIRSLEPAIHLVEKRMESFGFTNTQTEDALAKLTTATNDPKEALKQMGLAADIAASRHIGLSDASLLVAKALAGNLRPLKQMGIDLPITASNALKLKNANTAVTAAQHKLNEVLSQFPRAAQAGAKGHAQYLAAQDRVAAKTAQLSDLQHSQGQIMDALTQRFHGAAATAADTFAGKIAALKAKAQDLGKEIGLKLIPVIEKVIDVTMRVVKWFQKHQAVAKVLGVVIGTVLVIAIAAYVAGMVSAAVATIAATWPFLAIIAVIAAVAAGVIYAYTHWKWFRVTVDTVVHAIAAVAGWLWHNILGPFFGWIVHATRDEIIPGFLRVKDAVQSAWTAVGNIIMSVWNNYIKPVWDGLKAFLDDVNRIGNALSNIHLPKLPGGVHIPGFASGGSLPTGWSVVGEHGRELIHTGPGSSAVPNGRTERALGGGGGGVVQNIVNVSVKVEGHVRSDKDLAKVLRNEFLLLARTTPGGLFPAGTNVAP